MTFNTLKCDIIKITNLRKKVNDLSIVQSVDRSLRILEELANSPEEMSITQISENLELNKSTVHRLLRTLVARGFVIQNPETRDYKITFKMYNLGSRWVRNLDVLEISKPYTKKLMEEVNEIVHLVVLDQDSVIYVDKVSADNTIQMASNVGNRAPLYCTAVGKSILAHMSDEEIKEYWQNEDIIKHTEHTITDFDDLVVELEKVKSLGYAQDNEENETDVRCIGAPIFDYNNEVNAAISMSAPKIRFSDDRIDDLSQRIIKYANLISKELGYNK